MTGKQKQGALTACLALFTMFIFFWRFKKKKKYPKQQLIFTNFRTVVRWTVDVIIGRQKSLQM